MGSKIETNSTLQLTKEQGFPPALDLEKHLTDPLTAEMFRGSSFEQSFTFCGKPGHRVYQDPPINVFLVENRDGKWIYWGLVWVWDVIYKPDTNMTSGKFKIVYLYTPEEMRLAHRLIDRNPETDYFATL